MTLQEVMGLVATTGRQAREDVARYFKPTTDLVNPNAIDPNVYRNIDMNPYTAQEQAQARQYGAIRKLPITNKEILGRAVEGGLGMTALLPGVGAGVIKPVRGAIGSAVKALKQRGGKYIGAPHDLNITPSKMPWIMGHMKAMAKEGKDAWDWYPKGGMAFKDWFAPPRQKMAISTHAAMSPQAPVDLNAKFGVKGMNQQALGQPLHAGMVPSQARNMLEPIWRGEADSLLQTVKASKVPSFDINLQHGAGFPLSERDMFRSTQDRWMLRAGRMKGDMSPQSYDYLSAVTEDVAYSLGIPPHAAQAGVWTSLKARWESVAPAIQKKYVKKSMMRKSMIKNPKTGQREAIGPYEIKPEFARQYNDEIFNKAMKVDLPSSAFDEAGRSFDFFFDKMAKKYEGHSMEDLAPFIRENRVVPWDAQGIPHRLHQGRAEILMPEFEGVVDPSSLKQGEIADALIRNLRGESGQGERLMNLGGLDALKRFKANKVLGTPY